MPRSNEPTHPKITEDVDDVEAHAFRRSALPESEDFRKVGGTPERADEEADDVEGHARRPFTDTDDEVEGHARWEG